MAEPETMERVMRRLLITAGLLSSLLASPLALAQSQQGGYLGANPGGHAASATEPQQLGSMQGGYLGKDVGAGLKPMTRGAVATAESAPGAWCEASVDPGRCRSRMMSDHAWCAQHNPQHYASCRQTMDYMGWHN